MDGAVRGGIGGDLLQQTVHAVVAAVTTATKTNKAHRAQAPVANVSQAPVANVSRVPHPVNEDGHRGGTGCGAKP
jgi:hypothetical protein